MSEFQCQREKPEQQSNVREVKRQEEMEGVSEYEQLRLANIARNEAALRDLGLLTAKPAARSKRSRSELQRIHVDTINTSPDTVQRRRSARLSSKPPAVKEEAVEHLEEEEEEEQIKDEKKKPRLGTKTKDFVVKEEEKLVITPSQRVGSKSSKEISARLTDLESTWVGKVMLPPPGSNSFKEAAMVAAGIERPRFSKYSGIQPFANAVLLFVNAEPHDSNSAMLYDNTFFKDDENRWYMPWFAQSRQHRETPVIERLLSEKENVFLMCRIPAQPYVCCGRLRLKSADLDKSPMRFIWEVCQASASGKLVHSSAWIELLEFAGCQVTKQENEPIPL